MMLGFLSGARDLLDELDDAIKQVDYQLRSHPDLKRRHQGTVDEARDRSREARTLGSDRSYKTSSGGYDTYRFTQEDFERVAQKTYDIFMPKLRSISNMARQPAGMTLMMASDPDLVLAAGPSQEQPPYVATGKSLADKLSSTFGLDFDPGPPRTPEAEFVEDSVAAGYAATVAGSGNPTAEATTPGPGRVSAWFKPDEVAGFVDIAFKGLDFYQKQQMKSELMRMQAQNQPIQAPPAVIYRAKQAATPWGMIALIALGVVGVGAIVYSSGRRGPAPSAGYALARV
jgi:hypothetical protein